METDFTINGSDIEQRDLDEEAKRPVTVDEFYAVTAQLSNYFAEGEKDLRRRVGNLENQIQSSQSEWASAYTLLTAKIVQMNPTILTSRYAGKAIAPPLTISMIDQIDRKVAQVMRGFKLLKPAILTGVFLGCAAMAGVLSAAFLLNEQWAFGVSSLLIALFLAICGVVEAISDRAIGN